MSEISRVRFGVFELDTRTGELRKHGVRLKIQDQPFQVLQVLLERPGELVTREELQSRIWDQDTFVDFDQSLNRAINKVRDVLSDTAGSPRFIETLPRRGYRFIAPVEPAPPAERPPQPELSPQIAIAGRSYRRHVWVASCFLAIVGSSLWFARDRGTPPPPRLIPLTTLTGSERSAAFSPDGKQVAFSWDGEKQDNEDIYVKVVGDQTVLRLTTDPASDVLPAWSPDGRQIAFSRVGNQNGVYLVSPLGGPERKLAGLETYSPPSWSADAKFLLVAQRYGEGQSPGAGALFLVPVVGGGDPSQILAAPPGIWYAAPAYAPDGRSLAYVSCSGALREPRCTLQVTALKEGLIPDGEPRPIQHLGSFSDLAWTADGSSLIYSSDRYLWRVGVGNRNEAERLELAGSGASFPALDSKAGRLAFSRAVGNPDIWRLERGGKPSAFLTSSLSDYSPQYSPDGRRIAFESARGGDKTDIWIANADGTGLNQITRIASLKCGTPRWSPDGKWIAFDAAGKAGTRDIWVVEASGGSPRQLTHGPVDNLIPSWSHDGSSIYFASKRSGRFEIWSVPFHGGTEAQITRNGGYVAFESTDGKTLYYTVSESWTAGLFAKGLSEGSERQAMPDLAAAHSFAVFSDGLYYLYEKPQHIYEIRFYEFASGRVQAIGEIEEAFDMTVSPDRKTFLFTKEVGMSSDLMMIENFR